MCLLGDAHARADVANGHRGRLGWLREGDRAASRGDASEAAVHGQHCGRVGRSVRGVLLRVEAAHH